MTIKAQSSNGPIQETVPTSWTALAYAVLRDDALFEESWEAAVALAKRVLGVESQS